MVAKEDTRKMYDLYVPKSLRSNFPRTNGQGFISSLLINLKELLNTEADSNAPLRHHIEIVQEELSLAMKEFSKIAKQLSQFEELEGEWTQFLDSAYQTEYVIDSFLGEGDPHSCYRLGLFNVIEEIKVIKIELKAIQNKMAHEASEHKLSCFPGQITVEANSQKVNRALSYKDRDEKTRNKLVIFGKEAEEIRERLTNGSRKLEILSIVGMPGIGKTNFADSVFQHSLATRHFHVQAKCSVSQVYRKGRLLREILKQVTEGSNQCSDDDLEWKLYQSLKGRKYLIFMDDIWDIQPWMDVRNCFPNDENGSRIIFTSRFDEIARQVGSESIIYRLFPLSEDKSWEMLQVKLFGKESCPSELERLGRQIAVNCKGLPLTIDLIAGILLVKETKEWEKVAESITIHVLDDPQGRCRQVLELSYHNLPDELKPCFLYFAAFPGDSDVPIWKLISLWIAEGFIQLQENDPRCLEDAAEDILNNLIARSLIIVSKRRYLGRAKASRVHDLLHEFALAKAQEESFMFKIDGKTIFSSVSSGSYQWKEQYRLSICPDNWERFHEYPNPSGPRVRTLICHSDQVSFNLSDFKLLTVLDISQNILCFSPTMFEFI